MTENKTDLDSQLLYILEKMRLEFEVVKRQDFPSRRAFSRYERRWDVGVADNRWRQWAQGIGVDYKQLDALLEILV